MGPRDRTACGSIPRSLGFMLSIHDLHKRFGDIDALDGLTFEAHPGRILGFLGPNGAGKTTARNLWPRPP